MRGCIIRYFLTRAAALELQLEVGQQRADVGRGRGRGGRPQPGQRGVAHAGVGEAHLGVSIRLSPQ
jgi:hypothetical protein